MINLIPIEEKKKMAKSFFVRLATVAMMVFALTILIGAISLLPAYFFANVKKNSVDLELAAKKANIDPALDLEITNLANSLDRKMRSIENFQNNKFIVSERVINAVVLNKTSDIKITQISYDNSKPENKIIRITGFAPNRDRLTAFKKALEDDALFKQVDLPISNLVRGSNIKFSMTITPS